MDKTIEFLVNVNDSGKRADTYLSEKIYHLTRSHIKKLIEEKNLKINKIIINYPSTKVKTNDKISFKATEKQIDTIIPKKIKLDIVYEDDDILVVNKPKGMVVHPGAGNYKNTLVNALKYLYKNKLSDLNGELRPGIVHRIDKETSGLLVVAKNNLAHSKLGKQFSDHSIKRRYLCLIWGVVRPLNGRIENLITRNKKNRQLMMVSETRGKRAVTNYRTLSVFLIKDIPKISLVECKLETGRTHQIRTHFKFKGTSLLGDKQYGKKNLKFKKVNKDFLDKLKDIHGQALHAQSLEFIHPTKNKWVSFKTNLPLDFKKMLNFLKKLSS